MSAFQVATAMLGTIFLLDTLLGDARLLIDARL